ncbi:hypothetical protein ACLK1S_26440 [Escherichia coli]
MDLACYNYQQINVEAALAEDSRLTYQKLIALRKQEAYPDTGHHRYPPPNSPVLWCYRREWKGKPCWSLPTLAVIFNPAAEGKCAATGSL